jgi:hypothetical protein
MAVYPLPTIPIHGTANAYFDVDVAIAIGECFTNGKVANGSGKRYSSSVNYLHFRSPLS